MTATRRGRQYGLRSKHEWLVGQDLSCQLALQIVADSDTCTVPTVMAKASPRVSTLRATAAFDLPDQRLAELVPYRRSERGASADRSAMLQVNSLAGQLVWSGVWCAFSLRYGR